MITAPAGRAVATACERATRSMAMYDYFHAPDRGTAVALSEREGGPLYGHFWGGLHVAGVETKTTDPALELRLLLIMVLRDFVAQQRADIEFVPLGTDPEAEQVLIELNAPYRDAFADVDETVLPSVADAWARRDGMGEGAATWLLDFVSLTRRAKAAGDTIYCWACA